MSPLPPVIFIGGYTKSGTTFLGRTLEAFGGVYSRGEMDFLRLFAGSIPKIYAEYNQNLQYVNEEVYDGQGSLKPVTVGQQRRMLSRMFFDLFFNGEPVPNDCKLVIEKSPRNLFNILTAKNIFEVIRYVNIYRPAQPVFRSMMRHMADHRTEDYLDPNSDLRKKSLESFIGRWDRQIKIMEYLNGRVVQVQYDTVTADMQGFLDFANKRIFPEPLEQVMGVEKLTKEAYLQSLPPDRRETSLVQTKTNRIQLSDEEKTRLSKECAEPNVTFDF